MFIEDLQKLENITFPFQIVDHLGGFDANYNNPVLDFLNDVAKQQDIIGNVETEYIFNDTVCEKYKNLNLIYRNNFDKDNCCVDLYKYNIHPDLNFENFLCSFNGSEHISRKLLTSILSNQNIYNSKYCTKNFAYTNDIVYGHLVESGLDNNELCLYEKLFANDESFNSRIDTLNYIRFDHYNNIKNLEDLLTKSFLHIVSETIATSYYPFYTEKFLYSIATRGLFLSYAQPNWHKGLVDNYGFKLYDTVFDYAFDSVLHPVKRLVKLIDGVLKFRNLSKQDLHDLHTIEFENIEYNYDRYMSKDWLNV
jgi:hypothetical protein